MIVIVVASFGRGPCEARIRNGTGPKSELLQGTPVCYGNSERDALDEAKKWISPALVEEYGGVRIDIRDDLAMR